MRPHHRPLHSRHLQLPLAPAPPSRPNPHLLQNRLAHHHQHQTPPLRFHRLPRTPPPRHPPLGHHALPIRRPNARHHHPQPHHRPLPTPPRHPHPAPHPDSHHPMESSPHPSRLRTLSLLNPQTSC